MPGILQSRLHHECMSIVLANLQKYETTPVKIINSKGYIQWEILQLVVYICDLPE